MTAPKSKTLHGPLLTNLVEGQPYVDEPVRKPVPVYCGKEPMNVQVITHYRRTPLKWMKPGPGRKLVPQ